MINLNSLPDSDNFQTTADGNKENINYPPSFFKNRAVHFHSNWIKSLSEYKHAHGPGKQFQFEYIAELYSDIKQFVETEGHLIPHPYNHVLQNILNRSINEHLIFVKSHTQTPIMGSY